MKICLNHADLFKEKQLNNTEMKLKNAVVVANCYFNLTKLSLNKTD